jgi:hypothetical protein
MGVAAVPFVYAKPGIVLSLLVLGVLIASAIRLPLAVSALIVGMFALCHGYSHGAEMPHSVSGFTYAAGFVTLYCICPASASLIGWLVNSCRGYVDIGLFLAKQAGITQTLLHTLLQTRRDEIVQVTIQYALGVADFVIGAQILDARLVEHIAAYLVPPADVGLAVFQYLLLGIAFAQLFFIQP